MKTKIMHFFHIHAVIGTGHFKSNQNSIKKPSTLLLCLRGFLLNFDYYYFASYQNLTTVQKGLVVKLIYC